MEDMLKLMLKMKKIIFNYKKFSKSEKPEKVLGKN